MAIRVLGVGNSNVNQEDHRSLIAQLTHPAGAISNRAGLFPSNPDPAVLTNVSAMVVGVGPMRAVVQVSGPDCVVNSDTQINVTFDPGEAGVTRTDRIILRVYNDASDGSGRNEAVVEYLKGQTSGAATAVPSGALLLWEIPVPAGASSGGGGINFTSIAVDKRVYTTAAGGIIPVASTPDLVSTFNNPYDGMPSYVKSTDIIYVYDGSNWRPKSQISVSSAASLSNVSNPEDGTIGVVRDTDRIYVYNGTDWKRFYNEPSEIAGKQGITSGTFTGTAYADIPGVSALSFTKQRSDTKLRVDMKTFFFTTVSGSTGLQLGVRINGVDYDVAKGYTTEISSYKEASGFATVTSGLAAGTYSITPRWKIFSGGGTINVNSTISELDWSIREVSA